MCVSVTVTTTSDNYRTDSTLTHLGNTVRKKKKKDREEKRPKSVFSMMDDAKTL